LLDYLETLGATMKVRRRAFHSPPPVGAVALLLLLLASSFRQQHVVAIRQLEIAIPLQALTIWDPEAKEAVAESGGATFRSRFLPRFRAGLQAEADARRKLAMAEQQLSDDNKMAQQPSAAVGSSQTSTSQKNWAKQAATAERQQALVRERLIEQAYDEAVAAQMEAQQANQSSQRKNANKFQFVGVVNSYSPTADSNNNKKPPITWYARPKPATAKWSVRLVHVNREAVLKDLYNRGKIDVFGRYENTGERDPKTGQPIVTGHYRVRERSWK